MVFSCRGCVSNFWPQFHIQFAPKTNILLPNVALFVFYYHYIFCPVVNTVVYICTHVVKFQIETVFWFLPYWRGSCHEFQCNLWQLNLIWMQPSRKSSFIVDCLISIVILTFFATFQSRCLAKILVAATFMMSPIRRALVWMLYIQGNVKRAIKWRKRKMLLFDPIRCMTY